MQNERLISAEALLNALPKIEKDEKISLMGAVADFIVLILQTPTTDPENLRPHGRWIERVFPAPLSDSVMKKVQCNRCGTHWDAGTNFCPNCGAKMDTEG